MSPPAAGTARRAWTGRLRLLVPVRYAEIRLASGDVFTVEGTLEAVEKGLSDAARSGQARLAWFKEHGTDGRVGVNPAHVAALRASEISD
jgi:hypothetical protein